MRLVGTDDPLAVAAAGCGRFSAVVVGGIDAEQEVHLDAGAARLGSAEVTIVSATRGGGGPVVLQVEPVDGVVSFALPAGAVASVTAALEGQGADDGRFRGSGTWWLEHESGARLGLAATGEDERGAGARVAGVPADDRALAQRWRAEAFGGGSTRWVCEASGHQLDIERASKRSGAHAIQWRAGLAESAPDHNRFDVSALGGSEVALVARHSRLALALDDAGLGVQRAVGESGTRWRLLRAKPLGTPTPAG
jgi:hypothetical protein